MEYPQWFKNRVMAVFKKRSDHGVADRVWALLEVGSEELQHYLRYNYVKVDPRFMVINCGTDRPNSERTFVDRLLEECNDELAKADLLEDWKKLPR